MKIGIDARLWNETGVGRYIRNLVWNLQESDSSNEYALFVSQGLKIEDLRLMSKKWKVVETNIRWHTLEEQFQLPKVLEKENLDLVHFPYFSVPIYYQGPFVITIHDLIIHHYPTGKASTLPSPIYYLKLFGYKYVIMQAAKKAQKVITVSNATKDEIVKHLGVKPDKIEVTYEGVEERVKGEGESVKSKVTKKILPLTFNASPYFLYVGNAYPHKNLDRLIEAFKFIVNEFPDVKLIFVGKDDYFYRRLKAKIKKLGIEKSVIFAGFVSEEELGAYYHNALATIQPSLMEGFGLTGLEAMKQHCLVLASEIPSLREVYQDAAIYFDPLVVDSMRDTILAVLQSKQKFGSYIEQGEKRSASFSWKKMAQQTVKIYESSASTGSV